MLPIPFNDPLHFFHGFLFIISLSYAAINLSTGCLFFTPTVKMQNVARCSELKGFTIDTLMLDFICCICTLFLL